MIDMKKYVFPIIGFVLIVSACIGVYIYMKPYNWEPYLKKTLEWPSRPFIARSLSKIPNPKAGAIALDVGAGAGNETLLLLEKGFDVIAIDSEKVAFDLMLKRPEIIKHQSHLKTIQSTFQNIDFESLPLVDAVVASFSIPFCPPTHFNEFWQNLVSKIKPGGYFIGNTFDLGFTKFQRRPSMTFHDKQQTLDLFKDFNIVYFDEVKKESKENGQFEHFYIIFAQKK
jgi:tellurite methyltransferase